MSDIAVAYPVTVAFDPPQRIARWRPLVHWLLVIPHIIVLYALSIVSLVCVVIAWFSGVLTGRVPQGIQEPIVMTQRYSLRVMTYALFLTSDYPPFKFEASFADDGADPAVRLSVEPALTGRSRLTIFFRYFTAIPAMLALIVVGIAFYFVYIIAWFAVIILGRWPEGLRSFALGYLRWNARASAYINLLTDKYKPFSMQ